MQNKIRHDNNLSHILFVIFHICLFMCDISMTKIHYCNVLDLYLNKFIFITAFSIVCSYPHIQRLTHTHSDSPLLLSWPWLCCLWMVCVPCVCFCFRTWWEKFRAPLRVSGQFPSWLNAGVTRLSSSLHLATHTFFYFIILYYFLNKTWLLFLLVLFFCEWAH